MANFLQHQVYALQKEINELRDISEHASEILDTFLEKSTELEFEDREYVKAIASELRKKLNKLNTLSSI